MVPVVQLLPVTQFRVQCDMLHYSLLCTVLCVVKCTLCLPQAATHPTRGWCSRNTVTSTLHSLAVSLWPQVMTEWHSILFTLHPFSNTHNSLPLLSLYCYSLYVFCWLVAFSAPLSSACSRWCHGSSVQYLLLSTQMCTALETMAERRKLRHVCLALYKRRRSTIASFNVQTTESTAQQLCTSFVIHQPHHVKLVHPCSHVCPAK